MAKRKYRVVFKKTSPLVKAVILIAIVLSTIALVTLHASIQQNRSQYEAMREHAGMLEENNQSLVQQIDEMDTLETIIQIAMERNIFPHERALEENGYEEELRLFYVAVTRAKEELYLTRARTRLNRGMVRPALPSPFLELLNSEVAETVEAESLVKSADDDAVRRAFEECIKLMNG